MVMPGSLDYLYHYGILDHIPYEAYEMTPINNQAYAPMNGSQYIDATKQGLMYDTYTGQDTFVQRNSIGEEDEITNFKNSLTESSEKSSEKKSKSPELIKGAFASLILLGTTLFLLCRRKKAPQPQTETTSFFSKLNPKNWFKKN